MTSTFKEISVALILFTFASAVESTNAQYTIAGSESFWSSWRSPNPSNGVNYRVGYSTPSGRQQITVNVEIGTSLGRNATVFFQLCSSDSDYNEYCNGENRVEVPANQTVTIRQQITHYPNGQINLKGRAIAGGASSRATAVSQPSAVEIGARQRAAAEAAAERRRIEEKQRLRDQLNAEMERLEKERRAKELADQINAEMRKQTYQKGDWIYAPPAETPIPSDPDISHPADDWNKERANLISQRRAYPDQRFLNGPAPKDGAKVKGCKWETTSWTIWSSGCEDEESCRNALNGRNPVSAIVADAFGRPSDLGGYIVIENSSSQPVWFAVGGLGGQFNNNIPPKSKRKMFAAKYINRKTKRISQEISVRYCVPTDDP